MSDYISREEAMAFPLGYDHYDKEHGNEHFIYGVETYREWIESIPAAEVVTWEQLKKAWAIATADVVGVDDVAKMLTWLFADHCPCNYNGIDEWLPYVCELSSVCPSPKDELGCWKQFIKHHKAKMDGGDHDATD